MLDLGRVESLLPQAEQVPFERPVPGDRVKAYIVEVRKTAKGPQIVVSRTHPGLIKRLFELEVPEIADGIVEIKACAREPGHRTKIAVWSNDHNVDPVGACVGARGGRVRMVVNELRGEKIDIVPFSEDFADYVAKALSPAKVKEVIISDDGTQADVIVPDHQLSLAIGKEGQNARLAARLTGVRIDIRGETQVPEGDYADADYEEGEWVANAETGEMEWHAADGSVMTQDQWNAQAAGDAAAARDRPTRSTVDAEPADAAAETDADARSRYPQRHKEMVTTQQNDPRPIKASQFPSGCASDVGVIAPNRSWFAARWGLMARRSVAHLRAVALGCARSIVSTRPCDARHSVGPGDAMCRVPHWTRCGSHSKALSPT